MSDFRVATYDRLELTNDEAGGSAADLADCDWVTAGVAKVTDGRFGVHIQIGAYVGSLSLPSGRRLLVRELITGTVDGCLELAHPFTRLAKSNAAGRLAPAHESTALRFIELAGPLLAQGIEREYLTRVAPSSRPRGKPDIAATIKHEWSRGRRHRVVSSWRELSDDTPLARALSAAAIRAERVVSSAEARRDARVIGSLLRGAAIEHRPMLPESSDPELSRVLELARALIDGVPSVPSPSRSHSELSYWTNVDRLFEDAVLNVLRNLNGQSYADHGRRRGVQLLRRAAQDPPTASKRAEPDVVVTGPTTRILDAKYRSSGEHPSDTEIYQLMAHADAHGATAAALVTPALHGAPSRRFLGRMRSGCSIDIIAVDPSSPSSMTQALSDWNFETSPLTAAGIVGAGAG